MLPRHLPGNSWGMQTPGNRELHLQLCSGRGKNGTGWRTAICHSSRRSVSAPVTDPVLAETVLQAVPSSVPSLLCPFSASQQWCPLLPLGAQGLALVSTSKPTLRSSCPSGVSTGKLALNWLSQGHLILLGIRALSYHGLVTRHQPSSGPWAISSLETCACKSTHLCWKPTWGSTFLASQSRLAVITMAKQVLAALLILARERYKCQQATRRERSGEGGRKTTSPTTSGEKKTP